jgi:hypothetical protein
MRDPQSGGTGAEKDSGQNQANDDQGKPLF